MKYLKKHLSLALALVLCLSLAACGNSDDVAGDDWRTTGVVVGSGTIAHDGESVDVLVTVCESSAAFYRDLPEQVLFDSVSFPMNIPDAEQSFNAISFDDMDGDGESDVLVSFIQSCNIFQSAYVILLPAGQNRVNIFKLWLMYRLYGAFTGSRDDLR